MQQLMTKNTIATYAYNNIEKLSKDAVIALLFHLIESISRQFIMMGGLLYTIRMNKWYDPYTTFAEFCDTLTGIQYRKAMHLIQIYESLITNHIPFEDVAELGLTKMILLSTHFTEDTYKDMIAWAIPMTTLQIEEALKVNATKYKGFLDNMKGNASLSPDYKETTKTVKVDLSELKQLLVVTPVEMVIDALKLLYPDKEFTLA